MPYTDTGLPNGGRTQHFHVQFDPALPAAGGVDLATDLMSFCDGDFDLLSTFFPGTTLNQPIWVRVAPPDPDARANWLGWGPLQYEVTLRLGTLPISLGTPTLFLRYLLVVEVSEIYMRQRQFFPNYWFEASNEGSKGEALSLFLGVHFLRSLGLDFIPKPITWMTAAVSPHWLNNPSPRANLIDINVGDNTQNERVGCATLFLFYLRDQLGFGVTEIISHGGVTLPDVFTNLTGRPRTEGWNSFFELVNRYCPQGHGYFPPQDSIFPVADLSSIAAPTVLSWVSTGTGHSATVSLDRAAPVRIVIEMQSDHPAVIGVPATIEIAAGAVNAVVSLRVPRHRGPFTKVLVNLEAIYAQRSVRCSVWVLSPAELKPQLAIAPVPVTDRCARPFVEGESQEFAVPDLSALVDLSAVDFSWTVNGAAPATSTSPVLTIPELPAAGTQVTVEVTVTNALGVSGMGSFTFQTLPAVPTLEEQIRELRCRTNAITSMALWVPPWLQVEVEDGPAIRESLARLTKESARIAADVAKLQGSMAKLASLPRIAASKARSS